MITDGELEVVKRSRSADVPIARLGPGEIVGEMAVLEGSTAQRDHPGRRAESRHRDRPRRRAGAGAHAPVRRDVDHPHGDRSPAKHRGAAPRTREAGRAGDALRRAGPRAQQPCGRRAAQLGAAARGPRSMGRTPRTRWATSCPTPAAPPSSVTSAPRSPAWRPRAPPPTRSRWVTAPTTWSAYLAGRGVADAAELAASLASGGWAREHLLPVDAAFPGPAFGAVVAWIASGSEVHALVDEVGTGARRISEIVRAVKDYSYMDQAPVQQVDVTRRDREHARHPAPQAQGRDRDRARLRSPGCRRSRRSAASSTRCGRTSSTTRSTRWAATAGSRSAPSRATATWSSRSATTGRGCRPRSASGSSSPSTRPSPRAAAPGLGLHISHNVVGRHGGRIEVRSRPGETCFEVTLPIERRTGQG